jgi:hypothetical protein
MGAGPGCRDFAVVKRQAATGYQALVVRAPLSPGLRGRPLRPYLMRAKRDNPVGVPPLVTATGKPTVRKAQSPSGEGMTKKRMPVAER